MSEILTRWNEMDAATAAEEVLPCCGSRTWALGMAMRRPLMDAAAVLAAGDAVWLQISEQDWSEAFASHPRLGESCAAGAATERSLAWSGREQRAVSEGSADAIERLHEGNRAYEARFGRTFLVCASGKRSDELLRVLEQRMQNDAETELQEAREQQRQITRLRLQRWMGAA